MKTIIVKNKKNPIKKSLQADLIDQIPSLPILRKEVSSWVILSIVGVIAISCYWLGKRTTNIEEQLSENRGHYLSIKGEILVEMNKRIEDQKYLNSNTRLLKSSERSMKKYLAIQLEERDKRIEKLISQIKVYRLQRSPSSIPMAGETAVSKGIKSLIPYTKVNYRTLRYQQQLEMKSKKAEYKTIETNFVNSYPSDISGFERLRNHHKVALYKLKAQHSEKLTNFRINRYTNATSKLTF